MKISTAVCETPAPTAKFTTFKDSPGPFLCHPDAGFDLQQVVFATPTWQALLKSCFCSNKQVNTVPNNVATDCVYTANVSLREENVCVGVYLCRKEDQLDQADLIQSIRMTRANSSCDSLFSSEVPASIHLVKKKV